MLSADEISVFWYRNPLTILTGFLILEKGGLVCAKSSPSKAWKFMGFASDGLESEAASSTFLLQNPFSFQSLFFLFFQFLFFQPFALIFGNFRSSGSNRGFRREWVILEWRIGYNFDRRLTRQLELSWVWKKMKNSPTFRFFPSFSGGVWATRFLTPFWFGSPQFCHYKKWRFWKFLYIYLICLDFLYLDTGRMRFLHIWKHENVKFHTTKIRDGNKWLSENEKRRSKKRDNFESGNLPLDWFLGHNELVRQPYLCALFFP